MSRRVRNTRNAVKLRMKSYTVGNRRPKVEVLDYVGKIRKVEHSQHAADSTSGRRQIGGGSIEKLDDASNYVINDGNGGPLQSVYMQNKSAETDLWRELQNDLVKVHMRKEAPFNTVCSVCECETPTPIRCYDCNQCVQYCSDCEIKSHSNVSFHKPEMWKDGKYIPHISATKIIRRADHNCDKSAVRNMLVLDEQGRFHYNILFVFCGCEPQPCTLLRHGFWASTPNMPKVAVSLKLLKDMTLLMIESAVSTKAFIQVLRWKNGWSESEASCIYRLLIGECLSSYRNFLRRCTFLHLEISSQLSTSIKCPACPKDGGVVTMSMDANFGLVRKHNSGTSPRPLSLVDSYFIDSSDVDSFVNSYGSDSKKDKECSTFLAGDVLRSKARNARLDIRGVFGSVCRHEYPAKFMDMKHGERLAYPVFMIQKLRELHSNNHLQVIYDIGCVLKRHLERTNELNTLNGVDIGLPIFHSYGHGPSCQVNFSVRYLKGFGLTDGEGTERLWSFLRPLSAITKEMTPVHRLEVLNDALLHHNHRKTATLGKWLDMRADRAFQVHKEATATVEQVKAMYSVGDADLQRWIDEQKEQLDRKKKKQTDANTSWEMTYAKNIQSYYASRSQLQFCTDNTVVGELSKKLNELDSSLKKTERKQNFQRWSMNSDQYVQSLNVAAVSERQRILRQLFTDVCSHSFIQCLMKKYCDGQTAYIRLNKQLKRATIEIRKGVDAYNGVIGMCLSQTALPPSITVQQVFDRTAFLCCNDTSPVDGVPVSEKWRAVDQLMIVQRAVEEMQRVRDDISSTVTHFLNLHEALTSAAKNTCVATRALLFKKTEELIALMTDIWEVARKHLSECPPLPATRCESQREHFSECDKYLNASFDENYDTDSDDSDTE